MKLYLNPGACSMGPHIALHELGLDHQIEVVQIKKGEHLSPAHLARNPLGMVPVLQLEDGSCVTECMAIFLCLSERKPEAGLFPAGYRFLELMSVIACELHKSFLPLFYGSQMLKEDPSAQAELAEFYRQRLRPRWQWMNDRLQGQSWLHADQYSAADIYLYVVMNWWKFLGQSFDAWPQLTAFLQRMSQRPAVQQAHQHEKIPAAR